MPDGMGGGAFRVERNRFYVHWRFVAQVGLSLGFFFSIGASVGASLCGLLIHFAGWLR